MSNKRKGEMVTRARVQDKMSQTVQQESEVRDSMYLILAGTASEKKPGVQWKCLVDKTGEDHARHTWIFWFYVVLI